jgi:hypothetical protein
MIDFSWDVVRLSWDKDTGGVVQAIWTLTASEDGYNGYVRGSTDFSPDPSSDNFIPLEDLEKSSVVDWIKNNVINKSGLESLAVERMQQKKIPETVRGLPWD